MDSITLQNTNIKDSPTFPCPSNFHAYNVVHGQLICHHGNMSTSIGIILKLRT